MLFFMEWVKFELIDFNLLRLKNMSATELNENLAALDNKSETSFEG